MGLHQTVLTLMMLKVSAVVSGLLGPMFERMGRFIKRLFRNAVLLRKTRLERVFEATNSSQLPLV